MKNIITKAISVIALSSVLAAPAMAAGKTELTVQEFGNVKVSQSLIQEAQFKNDMFNKQFEATLDKNITASMDKMNKEIDQKIANKLSK